jgi:hypothetical protein
MDGPNPVRAAFSMLRARRVAPPQSGGERADHAAFRPVLGALAGGGIAALESVRRDLSSYLVYTASVDPRRLTRFESLAYWLNLYNAGALDLAVRAFSAGAESVLRVPGAFDTPVFYIAGELLSLDAIEHGKVRRFGDPRIHAALVCGSVSCPTLRFEPYRGSDLNGQLDDQMRRFLAGGGAVLDEASRTVYLSRVFLWFGGDFTRPAKMPTWLPARRRRLLDALRPWLDEPADWIDSRETSVKFQPYDWGLRCTVA